MIPRKQFVPRKRTGLAVGTVVAVVVIGILFAIPFTRTVVTTIFRAVGMTTLRTTDSVSNWFSWKGETMRTKKSLVAQNEDLKNQIIQFEARVAEDIMLRQNLADITSAMNRSEGMNVTLAAVLSKPPTSAYDTLVIDGGEHAGLQVGQTVFAAGATPIGIIESVSNNSALVRLYSSPGQETQARFSPAGIDITLVGRGGGNFSADVPHDLVVTEGAAAVTKELNSHLLAQFRKVTSDPRDPFQTVLLVAPVNIQSLSFVQVRQN